MSRRAASLLLAVSCVAVPAMAKAAEPLVYAPPEGTGAWSTETLPLLWGYVLGLQLLILAFLRRRPLGDLDEWVPHTGRGELVALGLLTGFAFALRAFLATPSAILSTFNDVKHLHDAMCLAGQAGACELTPAYPLGVSAVHALVLLVTGPSLQATYWANAVLGTLTIPLVWVLGTQLFGGRRSAGWLAAVALAALPLHVRFSASGAFTTGALFFLTLGLVSLLAFLKTTRPRDLWGATLAFSLGVQSRFEGPAFLLVAGFVLAFAAPRPFPWTQLRRRRWHLAAAALLLGLACWPALQAVLTGGGALRAGDLATLLQGLALVLTLAVGFVALGKLADALPRSSAWLPALALVLAAAATWCLLAYAIHPEHIFTLGPWNLYAPEAPVATYAEYTGGFTVLPLANPRALTVLPLALALLGIGAGIRKGARGATASLLLWAGLVTVLGVSKNTGSLPFQHMRTAVSGSVAVALLAALGGLALADAARSLGGALAAKVILGVSALALAASPLFALDLLTERPFNNAQQIAFLEDVQAELPRPAIVVFPADPEDQRTPLHRLFRVPEVWWTLGRVHGARDDRLLSADAALARPQALLRDAQESTVLFWEGLACFRTATDERHPDCAEMHRVFRLEPLATRVIPNRPFESDFYRRFFIVGQELRLTVYRVEGLRSPP